MSIAYAGAVAPEAYVLDLTPSGAIEIDLSTVTDAKLLVRMPDGTPVEWTADMSNQTATTLRLTHTFVDTDIPSSGDYRVVASLTVPLGTVRARPVRLTVLGPYEIV